jgi:hypothetical protein
MKLASKKKIDSLFGLAILVWPFSGWGWPRYGHSELVFSDGIWFSSRSINGTEYSWGVPHGGKPEDYDYLEIPCTKEEEGRVREWCRREVFNDDGSKCTYDVLGVIFSFLPIPIAWQSPTKWFCSEVCCAALQTIGWLRGFTPSTISPLRLERELKSEIEERKYHNWIQRALKKGLR